MKTLRSLVLRVYVSLERADWVARLAVRIAVGLMFFGGGVRKATHLEDFVAYFRSLHIPAPALQAPFVVCVEMLGGLGLMLGLATRPAAVMLSGTMVVALATAAIPEHHVHADWTGLLELLYLPEWLLLMLLGWLAVAGAGRGSVDRLIRRALEAQKPGE